MTAPGAVDAANEPYQSGLPEHEPLLEVRDLVKHFPVRGSLLHRRDQVHAVCGISFGLHRGQTLGLVGESGCGKTTTGRLVLRLIEATSGSVRFDGSDVLAASKRELRSLRRRMQMVFQDPFGSLNPRMTVKACGLDSPAKLRGLTATFTATLNPTGAAALSRLDGMWLEVISTGGGAPQPAPPAAQPGHLHRLRQR